MLETGFVANVVHLEIETCRKWSMVDPSRNAKNSFSSLFLSRLSSRSKRFFCRRCHIARFALRWSVLADVNRQLFCTSENKNNFVRLAQQCKNFSASCWMHFIELAVFCSSECEYVWVVWHERLLRKWSLQSHFFTHYFFYSFFFNLKCSLFYLQMEFLQSFYAGYRDLMDNKSDPRTNEWFLMSSPLPTIAISLTYAYCVKVSDRWHTK